MMPSDFRIISSRSIPIRQGEVHDYVSFVLFDSATALKTAQLMASSRHPTEVINHDAPARGQAEQEIPIHSVRLPGEGESTFFSWCISIISA